MENNFNISVLGVLDAKTEASLRKQLQNIGSNMSVDVKAGDGLKSTSAQVESLGANLDGIKTKTSTFSETIKTSSKTSSEAISAVSDSAKKASGEFEGLGKSAQTAGKGFKEAKTQTMSFSSQLKEAYQKFAIWSVATASWYGAIRVIGDAVEAVTDLDTALVELKKVSDLTTESQDAFLEKAEDTAEVVSRLTSDIVQSTAEFSRMGYAIDEALDLAEQAAILVNIGDGIEDIGEASGAVISILKGFNLEASETGNVLDKLNETSNKYAVTTSDLTTALTKSGASLAAANNDLDESIAIYTAGIEVLRDASRVGTSARTVSMRIRGIDENEEEIEGLTASLQQMFDDYGTGVQLMNEQTQEFNSTYDILKDLSKTWGELTDAQQASLTEAIAGKQNCPCQNVQKCA